MLSTDELKTLLKGKSLPSKRSFDAFSRFILFAVLFAPSAFCDEKPPFRDPRFPTIEKAIYDVQERGRRYQSTHTILCANHNNQRVYVISTDTLTMVLRADDLRTLSLKESNSHGELECSIEYYKQDGENRVRFIYPGPERNKVEEIPEDSYDVNTILEVLRGYPFEKDEVKFTLVTADHVVGVYAKMKGEEKVTTPVRTFDCYFIEAGVLGLKGKIIRTKFLFWIEKEYPYRVIKQVDSNDENIITLVGYEVLPDVKTTERR